MAAPIVHLDTNASFPDHDRRQIRWTVQSGGVLVFPTDTIYGLGCDASNAEAVDRIYQLKDRPSDQPLSVHLATIDALDRYAEMGDVQRSRIQQLLPGPYTVILTASSEAPRSCVSPDGKIGLRVPDSTAFQAVSEAADRPLVGTSVNRSGEASLNDVETIQARFGDDVDLIVATDASLSGAGSTVIDLTQEPPVALRGELPPDW
ncbi:MAG: L-threonylcarbamoyladenylate synthase [Candidatus Bipolaricaulia bacterium]